MTRHRTAWALVLLGLLTLTPFAAADEERPAADEVARWILEGNRIEQRRAVAALDGAPPTYLARVVQAIRARAKGPDLPPPPEIVAVEPGAADLAKIELALWSVPGGTTKRLFREPADSPAAHGTPTFFQDADDFAKTRTALETTPGARLLQGPSLLVEDRQEASLAVTEEVRYTESYQLVETLPVAIQATVDEGVTLSATPVISRDRRYVTLDLALNYVAVDRPIPTKPMRLEGRSETFQIQAPVIRETAAELTVTVPDHGWVALTGQPDARDPARELIVLVGVSLLNAQAMPPALPPPAPDSHDGPLIQVEAKVLAVSGAVVRRVLGDRAPDAQVPFRILRAEEVLGLLGAKREGARGVKVLSAPKLTTYDGQRANVSVLNQVSYVKDFEVNEANGKTVVDPIIETIQDGLILELTPRIAEDRTGIALDAEATWADLSRPIAEFKTKIHDQEVTIQIPELSVSRAHVSGKVAPGGYALIGGLGEAEDGQRFVLLHLSVIRLDDLESATPR